MASRVPALNLRVKLLVSVLLIIGGMTALTVRLGGRLIGEELRRETINSIASTAENYQAAADDVARSLAQGNRMLAEGPVLKAAASTDDVNTVVHLIATTMEDSRADTFLWLHKSGVPAAFLERRGDQGKAYLGEIKRTATSDLFDFGDGGGAGGAASPEQGLRDLADLLGPLKRRWTVEALPEAAVREALIRYLGQLNARVKAAVEQGRSVDASHEEGSSLVSSWEGRLYLFSFRPVVYDQGKNYDGIICSGFEMADDFATRISTLTRSELTFLRVGADRVGSIAGFGAAQGSDTLAARARAEEYGRLLTNGALRPEARPITAQFGDSQWVVQAEPLQVIPGSDMAVRVIAGNLTARLGILATLNDTLLSVSGVAAVLALILITLGMGAWVSGPVEELTRGMQRIQNSDYSTKLEVRSRDEMGTLAEAYNQMVVELQKKEQYMRMVSKSAVKAVESRVSANLEEGGERRVVTVLFCDIRGFTTLCERIDPNKLVHLLNRYFDAMVEIIYRHGGLLDKFIGDAIMAIFEGDEHPRKAVLAALEMMEEVARLDRDENLGIRIGVGLHTGEVIAGFVGAKEFMNHTYLGDTVNVSARLEGVSKHGKYTKVILSQATLDGVPGLVEVERLDIDHVKGKTEAVHMYEVVRLRRTREILEELRGVDVDRRCSAALLLGRLGGPEALPELVRLVDDAEDRVALAALQALRTCVHAIATPDAVVPRLVEKAGSRSSPELRSSIVKTLGKIGGFEHLAVLRPFLEDENPRVRANAIEALEDLAGDATRRLVEPLLADGNNRVKANAAICLFEHTPEAVTENLADCIRHPDARFRASAAFAVFTLAGRYPPELMDPERAKNLDSRTYQVHASFKRLAGVCTAALHGEKDELVLRNLIPAIKVLLGAETTRQLTEEVFQGQEFDSLRASGVLTRSAFEGALTPRRESGSQDAVENVDRSTPSAG